KVPSDYIVTNNANNTTLALDVGDIVGLDLDLPYDNSYTLITSDQKVLAISEPLSYNVASNTYNAVLHPQKEGNYAIKIRTSDSCSHRDSIGNCQPTIFQLTLKVNK